MGTNEAPETIPEENDGPQTGQGGAADGQPAPPATAAQPNRTPRPRKKPRALRLLPTQPEGEELKTIPVVGRKSPSSFARERMRAIAAKNGPFDDPDRQRPKWRRAVGSV